MRRLAPVLIAVGLLAAVLWWLIQSSGQWSAAEELESDFSTTEAVPATGIPGAESAVEPVREALPSVADDATGAGPADVLLLRVVRRAGGPGVPGARLHFVDFKAPENEEYRAQVRDHYRDREATAAALGTSFTSGADGTIRVPRVESAGYFARLGNEYAEGFLNLLTPDETQVLLQTDLEARVLVLDQDNRPVPGIQVAWLAWQGEWTNEEIRARSGADGIARLQHLQTRLPQAEGRRHMLALRVPGTRDGQISFDPSAPPTEPVVLRLPACGSVILEVLDADGRPFPDGTRAFVQLGATADEKSIFLDYRISTRPERDSFYALLKGGQAVFSHVGIGMPLEYGVFIEERSTYFGAESEGLTAAGQELRLLLRESVAPTRLLGRLVRVDGSPIANAAVGYQLLHEEGSQGGRIQTEADGRFSHFLDEEQHPPSPDRRLWLAAGDPGVLNILATCLELHEALGPGDHDFGAIVLGSADFLAAGRVVNEAGEPLAGIQVSVGISRAGLNRADISLTRGPRRDGHVTGADGRFALSVSGAPNSDWMLHFAREGQKAVTLRSMSGRRDHEVLMGSPVRIQGRLLLDPEISSDQIRLIWARDGKREHGSTFEVLLDSELCFVTKEGIAGTGVLTITTNRFEEVLARLENVLAEPGGKIDPRLDPLDLRGAVHAYTLRVFDSAGLQPGRVTLVREDEAARSIEYFHNPVRLLHTQPGRPITVFAPGCASQSLTLDRPEIDVRLQAGTAVSYRLKGIPWPQEGLELFLTPNHAELGMLQFSGATFSADGRAAGSLPEPGRYTFNLRVALTREGKFVGETFLEWPGPPGASRQVLVLEAGMTPGEFEIVLRQEDLDAALKRLE